MKSIQNGSLIPEKNISDKISVNRTDCKQIIWMNKIFPTTYEKFPLIKSRRIIENNFDMFIFWTPGSYKEWTAIQVN